MSPLAPIRKAVLAVFGLVAQLVALNVLHGQALQVAQGVLAGATALGVYFAPNVPGVPVQGVAVSQLDDLAAPLLPPAVLGPAGDPQVAQPTRRRPAGPWD